MYLLENGRYSLFPFDKSSSKRARYLMHTFSNDSQPSHTVSMFKRSIGSKLRKLEYSGQGRRAWGLEALRLLEEGGQSDLTASNLLVLNYHGDD